MERVMAFRWDLGCLLAPFLFSVARGKPCAGKRLCGEQLREYIRGEEGLVQ